MKMSAMCRHCKGGARGSRYRHKPRAFNMCSAAHNVALPHTSLFGARLRAAVALIAARPDGLWEQADCLGHQPFHRRPLLLECLACRRWMVPVCNRQFGQIVASLLESCEHVRRMPVLQVQWVALATVPCIH